MAPQFSSVITMPSIKRIPHDDFTSLHPFGLQYAQLLSININSHVLNIQLISFEAERFHTDAYRHAALPLPHHIHQSRKIRQAEFFFGRLTARMALGEYGLENLEIHTGLNREPIWPLGMLGSITHNRNLSGAVAQKYGSVRGVGIDLESTGTAEQHDAIASVAINSDELSIVTSSLFTFGQTMTLFFSAKECFYKATYRDVGHFFGFEAISITRIDAAAGRLSFIVRVHLSDSWPAGATGTIHFIYLDNTDLLTIFIW